jgi:2-polyprenyl-3-methyl-5-hydroxy-6-metoxy-1,4-benzoquinol methylase
MVAIKDINYVKRRIEEGDSWYIGSQFEWANRPELRPIYNKRARFILNIVSDLKQVHSSEINLIDIGCGDGYWLSRLEHIENLNLSGIDFNPVRVGRATQNAPSARIMHSNLGDIYSMAEKQLYDIVLFSHVIEHIHDDLAALQAVRSVLKPNGILILGAPNEGSMLQQYALKRSGVLHTTDHVHFYTEKEVRTKIKNAGFKLKKTMREAFYPGTDRVYYGLVKRPIGFKILSGLSVIFPSQCSGYFFACEKVN